MPEFDEETRRKLERCRRLTANILRNQWAAAEREMLEIQREAARALKDPK